MALDNEVKVKIVIDNDEANARIGRTDTMLRGLHGSARVGGGGGGGGMMGALGGGGGPAGLAAGIAGSWLGAAAAAAGAYAFAPLARDASTVASGALGWIGQGVSSFLGLQGMAGQMTAVDRAAQSVTQALGPSRGVSDATIDKLLKSYEKIYEPMAENERRVGNVAGIQKRDIVVDSLERGFNRVVEAINKIGGTRG